ncbi:MAG TPA: hypothetical protein VFZ32_05360 [Micromonosporaceae bacterium]
MSTWALVLIAGMSAVAQNAWNADGPLGTPAMSGANAQTSARAKAKAAAERRKQAATRAARSTRAVPAAGILIPRTPQGRQASFWPKPQQVANARTIVQVGRELGLPPRATVIAIATALQESHLNNYGHLGDRNDHDSLGLFQQRPSAGWGTPQQVTNPRYAATRFYRKLMRIRGWQHRPLTQVAQSVQVSAFPLAYAKWEAMAAHLVRASYGIGPFARIGK